MCMCVCVCVRACVCVRVLMKSAKQTYEQKLVATFQQKPQRLHSYIRHLSANATTPTKIYPLNSNAITSTTLETATAFNNYFHSIYTTSNYTLPDIDLLPLPSLQLHTIKIQTTDVESAIKNVNNSKANGCDDIDPPLTHCMCQAPTRITNQPIPTMYNHIHNS